MGTGTTLPGMYIYIYKLMISNRGQEQMGQAGSVVLTNLDLRSYKNILVDYVVYHCLRYRAEKGSPSPHRLIFLKPTSFGPNGST